MKPALKRRMALSRQMLQRPLPVRSEPAAVLERPLTDNEHAELLDHDVHRWRQDASLLDRAIWYIDERIREAQRDVDAKRQDLQVSWTRLQALESERRQILAEQAAALTDRDA